MKNIILLVSLLGLLLVGCNDDSSILDPLNEESTLSKKSNDSVILQELNLDDDTIIKTHYSKSFTITSDSPKRLNFSYFFKNEQGRNIQLSSTLKIPKGAFDGELTFEMVFDLKNFAMEFYPSPYQFKKPVLFTMQFFNLDLSEYADCEWKFNYLDGKDEEITEYRYMGVDIKRGDIKIVDAELHHFSRYGWTRTR